MLVGLGRSPVSVLSRVILDNSLAPLGEKGGERSEPGEGVNRDHDCQNYVGHDTSDPLRIAPSANLTTH